MYLHTTCALPYISGKFKKSWSNRETKTIQHKISNISTSINFTCSWYKENHVDFIRGTLVS